MAERSGRVPDRIVSPVDPEARWGRTGYRDARPGYKANLMMTAESQFITTIRAIPGGAGEEEATVEMVAEQHPVGLKPAKLLADSKYSSVPNITGLGEMGTTLVTPLKRRPRRYGTFGADEFTYLPEEDRLRCPAGQLSRFKSRTPYGPRFKFAEEDCRACSLKERCLSGSEAQPFRMVTLHHHHRAIQQLRDYMKSEPFTEEMKRRRLVEPKIAELVRWHGLRRARYRGLAKANLQCLFTALAVNIKRWFKLIRIRAPALSPA